MKKNGLISVLVAMFLILGSACTALAIEGDITGNGQVGIDDLADLCSRWLDDCSANSWCYDADINHSGKVDLVDFSSVSDNWGKSDITPVIWYKLDEGSGPKTLDSSGNSNHGEIFGAMCLPAGWEVRLNLTAATAMRKSLPLTLTPIPLRYQHG